MSGEASGRAPRTPARSHSAEEAGSEVVSSLCCQAQSRPLPFIFMQKLWMTKSSLLSFDLFLPLFFG